MTHVSDEQLGKIARQGTDLFRRVREGSLGIGYASRGLQDIIEGKYGKPAGLPAETSARASRSYSLLVDYERSVEEAVKAGGYDQVNPSITSRVSLGKWLGTVDLEVELIHLNPLISNDRALLEIRDRGYRPADLHELLAFGQKYPDIQRGFPIAALGSIWLEPCPSITTPSSFYEVQRVPCLEGTGSERRLSLCWIEYGSRWRWFYRFAVVRHSTEA